LPRPVNAAVIDKNKLAIEVHRSDDVTRPGKKLSQAAFTIEDWNYHANIGFSH
jgi:hypothetical protein